MSSRRELLKKTIFGLGAAASLAMIPEDVREAAAVSDETDWAEMPTFYYGKRLLAEDMTQLTEAIIQLQNEVARLKGARS